MARELGIRKIAIPSAGNAASAAPPMPRLQEFEAHIFMPKDVPQANYIECKALGAKSHWSTGSSATVPVSSPSARTRRLVRHEHPQGALSRRRQENHGYEVAEQFDWELPDAIFYPTAAAWG
jgi:threonine synthase